MGDRKMVALIDGCKNKDILLVMVYPAQRETTPTTTPEINDRLNEMTLNATLMPEMRVIPFVAHLRDLGRREAEAWLDANIDAVGLRSTVNIESAYL